MAGGFELVQDDFEDLMDDVQEEARILVVGVGSAGVNALNTMLEKEVSGVDYLPINTDRQSLQQSRARKRMLLRTSGRQGLGTGGDPVLGREAALQAMPQLEAILADYDMVVIATGFGGGTGSGVSPVLAEIASRRNVLSLAVVCMPFDWECAHKKKVAEDALADLRQHVDSYILIPNDRIYSVAGEDVSTWEAYARIDQVLCDTVSGVVELITRPGFINRDFRDVQAVLSKAGRCVIGVGTATGPDRAVHALEMAVNNPLLQDCSIEGADRVLVQVVQGQDGKMLEQKVIGERLAKALGREGQVNAGLARDDSLTGSIRVTVIASGIEDIEPLEAEDAQEEDPGWTGSESWSGARGSGQTLRGPVETPREARPSMLRHAPRRGTPGTEPPEVVNGVASQPAQYGLPTQNPIDGESEWSEVPAYTRIPRWERPWPRNKE